MAYDEHLVAAVRARLGGVDGVDERKMFGGWCATVSGHMAVGVLGDDLIVRVGRVGYEEALGRPGVRPFDFSGRPMTGWVYVDGAIATRRRALDRWVDQGVAFAQGLAPKASAARTRRG
jgi:TfoX/Sxy family transcriptional regulator of competence genes